MEALQQACERGLEPAAAVDAQTSGQGLDLVQLLAQTEQRLAALERYRDAYRQYCWPTDGLEGIRLAPFHLLATQGRTYFDCDHEWHMQTIARYCANRQMATAIIATPYMVVDTGDAASVGRGTQWWQELTEAGGEGMVVKPYDFVATDSKGLLQPAIKCRGREYLRIIYGPEYLLPDNLPKLKKRSLGRKRALALREFALGVESLERFVAQEPFYRVHESVFAVLAMESEPVDPRL